MPRKPASTVRSTIYRLGKTEDLRRLVRGKYTERESFEVVDVEVAGLAGLLVRGEIQNPHASWNGPLSTMTGQDVTLGNSSASAVLLLTLEDAVYAVCFGMGHQIIDYGSVEPGFGLAYASRVVLPDELRSVTRHTMGGRARIDRSSLPDGGDVRAFGLADFGALVSKVIGRGQEPDSAESKAITIRGADGLNLPLPFEPGGLVKGLRGINDALAQPVPHPDLELLTRLTPLMPRDPRRQVLNGLLADALRGQEGHLLGAGWPWDQTDEFNTVDAVQLIGQGAGREMLPWLTLDNLMAITAAHPKRDPVKLLRNLKAVLLSGDEAVSPQISALKWIAFETRINDTLYFFHDGRWFTMTGTYHEQIRAETDRILSQTSPIQLPPWMTGDEKAYNIKVAKDHPTFLALDRKLIHTVMHPRGIEHCDLLGPGDEFIHVKDLRGSDEASHLFSQALVATDQLLLDGEGRQKFADKVQALSGGARTAPERPKTVVLGIAGRGQVTVDTLFTFSQVTLVRLVQQLEGRGVSVRVASIQRPGR